MVQNDLERRNRLSGIGQHRNIVGDDPRDQAMRVAYPSIMERDPQTFRSRSFCQDIQFQRLCNDREERQSLVAAVKPCPMQSFGFRIEHIQLRERPAPLDLLNRVIFLIVEDYLVIGIRRR